MQNAPEKYAKMLESMDFMKQDKANQQIDKAWLNFTQKHGLRKMPHIVTPYSQSENLIEAIKLAGTKKNAWKQKLSNSLEVDYKKEFKTVISEVKNQLKDGESLSCDVDKLDKILDKSKTPMDALKHIEKELKLKPMVSIEKSLPELQDHTLRDINTSIDMIVMITPQNKMYLDIFK